MSRDVTLVLQEYFKNKMSGFPAEIISNKANITATKILPEYYPLVEAFAEGKITDTIYGEFSLFNIMKGTGCDYIDALVLLSGYVKNPTAGKREILFHR